MVKHRSRRSARRPAPWLALLGCVALSAGGAHAEGLYLSLGVGAVGVNDLVDYDNRSVHNTPVGRAELSYQVIVNPNVTLGGVIQHFSSLQADDGGLNWAGVELGVRF